MELYFGSMHIPDSNSSRDKLVTFAIPDIGVRFKAPYQADDELIDYASLLTLLEFIDINPQLFRNRSLELYCNNFDLVKNIQSGGVTDAVLAPLLEKAMYYQEKFRYSLNWVPRPDNPAQDSITE